MEKIGRRLRIHRPQTIQHVMVRGNNRQPVFFGDRYFNRFLEVLADSVKKYDHKILAYCLMTNHIHLIVYIQQTPLSKIMQNINYRYVRWANHQLGKIGHLFQGRFRSVDVCDQAYLINLCKYIHFNPVAARMVELPENYKWSSYNAYLTSEPEHWLDIEPVKAAIKHVVGLEYQQFITRDIDRKTWRPAFQLDENGGFYIDDHIMKKISAAASEEKTHVISTLPADQIMMIAC